MASASQEMQGLKQDKEAAALKQAEVLKKMEEEMERAK